MKPNVGQWFEDGAGRVCQMVESDHYKIYGTRLRLMYMDGVPEFSSRKLLNDNWSEVKLKGDNQMNTEFKFFLRDGHDLGTGLQEIEAAYIEHVYWVCHHNQSRTAKVLGLSRGCLRTKLKQYFGDKYL